MEPLGDVSLGLLHQLAGEEHARGGAVAGDVVLRGGLARDHRRGGVLQRDFVEQLLAVLGQLDQASAAHHPSRGG